MKHVSFAPALIKTCISCGHKNEILKNMSCSRCGAPLFKQESE